jgi:hypothetical protein
LVETAARFFTERRPISQSGQPFSEKGMLGVFSLPLIMSFHGIVSAGLQLRRRPEARGLGGQIIVTPMQALKEMVNNINSSRYQKKEQYCQTASKAVVPTKICYVKENNYVGQNRRETKI